MQALRTVYENRSADNQPLNGLSPTTQKAVDEWVEAEPDPEPITDPRLRFQYERSKAREKQRPAARPVAVPQIVQIAPFEPVHADREPVQKPARNGAYAHGLSMAATLDKVCMRPDITWRGKSVALALASHWPNVRPTNQRLRLLTGHSKNTVARGLAELKAHKLLTWKRGTVGRANEYTCHWLSHRASQGTL